MGSIHSHKEKRNVSLSATTSAGGPGVAVGARGSGEWGRPGKGVFSSYRAGAEY
jgi:hypothetical protein